MAEALGVENEKSARQTVSTELSKPGADPARAAALISGQISSASRSTKDPRAAIVGALRGSMDAVHILGVDVPDTAVKVLESLQNMSLMMRVGPEELMTWVMEGIAEVAPLVSPEIRDALRTKIGERFMGADEVFGSFCDKALQKTRG